MNEGIAPFLDIKMEDLYNNENLIQKIDSLLLECGLKYSGIMNIYFPIDIQKRDDIVFDGIKALRNCGWLKGTLSYVCICNQTDVCELNDIITCNMSQPKRSEFEYYESCFRRTNL